MKLQASAANVKFNLTDDAGNVVLAYEYDKLAIELNATTAVKAAFELAQAIMTQAAAFKEMQRNEQPIPPSDDEWKQAIKEASEHLSA